MIRNCFVNNLAKNKEYPKLQFMLTLSIICRLNENILHLNKK